MDWKKAINKTIEYVFYGIAAVQMVMGTIWLCCQFPHMQNWQETYEYLDISKTWVMDEYVSFLYPLFLNVCTGIESVTGMPFYMPVYIIQLAVAVLASWYFVKTVLKLSKVRTVWAVGYLVSFPMLLQFHMSVRVESLGISGIMVLIALLMHIKHKVLEAAGLTLLLIFLQPDMAVLCITVWIIYLFGQVFNAWKERKNADGLKVKKIAVQCGIFALALIVGITINGLIQTPGSRGRIQKTFWASMFQRVVSDYFAQSFIMWNVEVWIVFSVEDSMEMEKRSDNMMYVVGPKLENEWGREKANELYRDMALTCFRLRTKDVVFQVRDDLTDAALMPFSVWWQDDGERMSQTGWNYGRFRENTGVIANKFWYFGVVGLYVLLILGMIKHFIEKSKIVNLHYILGAAFVQCLWNVLSTGDRVSYAKVVLVILFWNICAVTLCLNLNENRNVEK